MMKESLCERRVLWRQSYILEGKLFLPGHSTSDLCQLGEIKWAFGNVLGSGEID
jgi:hypothetical protein